MSSRIARSTPFGSLSPTTTVLDDDIRRDAETTLSHPLAERRPRASIVSPSVVVVVVVVEDAAGRREALNPKPSRFACCTHPRDA
jgi:hypothetical protein